MSFFNSYKIKNLVLKNNKKLFEKIFCLYLIKNKYLIYDENRLNVINYKLKYKSLNGIWNYSNFIYFLNIKLEYKFNKKFILKYIFNILNTRLINLFKFNEKIIYKKKLKVIKWLLNCKRIISLLEKFLNKFFIKYNKFNYINYNLLLNYNINFTNFFLKNIYLFKNIKNKLINIKFILKRKIKYWIILEKKIKYKYKKCFYYLYFIKFFFRIIFILFKYNNFFFFINEFII